MGDLKAQTKFPSPPPPPTMANYKAHLFQSLGNGKLHPSRMQCGRHINRNSKGTHAVKTAHFKRLYEDDAANVCDKCLQWAKDNKKII